MNTKYEECIAESNLAFAKACAAAKELPVLPDTGCVCGAEDDLQLEEFGYVRWTTLRRSEDDEPCWLGITDGWDDMSDSGNGPTVVWCQSCNAHYQQPDDLEWI